MTVSSVTVWQMRVGAWVVVVMACGMACGPTAAEIKTARAATYEITPREVYAAAEKETARSYRLGERMPDELVFATAPQWFTDRGRPSRVPDDEQKKAGNMQVSFAVLVTAEGSGSKVLVTASALDYVKDKPDPQQLDEAALPKWLNDRTDKLRVQIHKRVQAMLSARAKK